jgi:hypothetical protein
MASTATGSGHSLDYIEEVTYGTTPATPSFIDCRHTGTTLALTKTTLESAEIRADRQIPFSRHGNKQVGGDVSIEMSYGSHDDLLEAVTCGTWATDTPSAGTDQLKVGTTRRSFTFERKFSDLDTPEYHRYTGVELNTFSMSVAPDAIVTSTFGCIGKDYSNATSIISGATYGSPTTTEPFDSFSGVVTENSATIAIVTSIEFTLENGLTPLFVVGSDTTLEPGIARSRVTGTLGLYFQSAALLDKFIDETASDLDFTLVDAAGNQYQFFFPNIRYNGGQPDVSGDGEIQISMPFIAIYDSTSTTNFYIERNPV